MSSLNRSSIYGKVDRVTTTLLENEMKNEMKTSAKFFDEQNNIDEKITNNKLILNVLIYLFTLAFLAFFVFYADNIFYMSENINLDSEIKLKFSLLKFSQEGHSNYYDCIKDFATCENNCSSVNLIELKNKLQFECIWFNRWRTAGIIVN